MPFYVNQSPSSEEVSDALNYLLANLNSQSVGNATTGQIIGSDGKVFAYLYKYLNIKYADSFDGTLNFSNDPTNKLYYGLRNSDSSPEPSSPIEYVWTKVTGGFGTTLFLWYVVTGGRNIQFQVAATKPLDGYQKDSGDSIDLDNLTGPSFNPAYVIIYRAANDSSSPTNLEFQTAISRNPIDGDTSTISYNGGTNSIQYSFMGGIWTVMQKYITGDIIESLEGYYGAIATVTHEDFDNNTAAPSYLEGRVFYDRNAKTLAYYNENNQITVNLGQEMVVRVYNATGTTIDNGKVCYMDGGFTDVPTVALADASSFIMSDAVLGISTTSILNNSYGYITTSGIVHSVDTSLYPVGTSLYLSDVTPGEFTNVLPTQPNYNIAVGNVAAQDAINGDIFVHVERFPWFPNLELLQTSASVTLPTTPTVFVMPTIEHDDGFTYNTTTGVITVDTNGTYTLVMTLNAVATASNKSIYFYIEEDKGSGWVIERYSARQHDLVNNLTEQVVVVSSEYFRAGTKIRFYIWATATITLQSVDLPGTTAGTVTLAGAQFSMA